MREETSVRTPRCRVRQIHIRLIIAVSLVTTLAPASAWACVPWPILSVQPRSSGPPRSQVTVVGQDFPTESVEVRWNALDGPLLGKATSSSFSLPITIPADAPDGLYLLLVVSRDPGGRITRVERVAFQVVAAAPAGIGSAPTPSPMSRSRRNDTRSRVTLTLPLAVGAAMSLVVVGGVGGLILVGHRRKRSILP